MTLRPKRHYRPTWHLFDETKLVIPTKIREAGGKSLLTALACSDCDVVFFEGTIRSVWDRITYKAAEDSALIHQEMGHEVYRSLPKRVL